MPGWASPWEWLLLLIVLLIIFATKKIPEIGRSMGQGLRGFKAGIMSGGDDRKEKTTPELKAEQHD
jgi:sec-independent protein translocase protein TatA